jgi:glycolate dehydrogenase FAD-binding subunit
MTLTAVGKDVGLLRDRVRDARASGTPVRVRGRGLWLGAGRPVVAQNVVSTGDLSGIVEYVPGDLTLTALAGTSLAEISAATRANGQWLALDPHGSDDGSLGATVATASFGPLATAFGGPRDLVLGVEVITGMGVVIRGGGRVVKNVAGFDLTRLMTGSWGTFGIITEVSVRLHALPEATVSLAISLQGGAAGVEGSAQATRALPFTPFACEIVNATLARQLGVNDDTTMLVRLGGNEDAVLAQTAAFRALGDTSTVGDDVWLRLRAAEGPDAATMRLSGRPSSIGETWGAAASVAERCPDALLQANPKRGVVRCIAPHADAAVVRDALDRATAVNRVGERLPAAAWEVLPPPANDRLSRGIRDAFDPDRILNPGILGAEA